MLSVSNISKRFDDLTVFEGLSFTVKRGGFTTLVGPSGCGKSTLFDVLTGVVEKDAGVVSWLDEEMTHVGKQTAYMQQKDLLLPWLSLCENALLPVRIAGKEGHAAREKVKFLFRRFGLQGFEHFTPGKVSGGMKQRCALVRTLMFEHELVLLDEPLSALDAITRRSLQRVLSLLQSEFSKTILMITHDVEEALLLSDEIFVMTPFPMSIRERFEPPSAKPRKMSEKRLMVIKERIMDQLAGESEHAAA